MAFNVKMCKIYSAHFLLKNPKFRAFNAAQKSKQANFTHHKEKFANFLTNL